MVVIVLVVDSHIQRIVLATVETGRHNKSVIYLSNANPARGHKEVRTSTGAIMVTARYSNQQDPNRRRTLARSNQPRTPEICQRQDDIFGYELQSLLSGVLPIFQNLNYKLHKRLSNVLPNQQSHEQKYKNFFSFRRATRRQVMRHFTGNGVDQFRNGSSNLLNPYREQPPSTRIVVAYDTHDQRSWQQSGQTTLQSVLINKPNFLNTTHHTETRKMKYRDTW